jgi:hypothetical protein
MPVLITSKYLLNCGHIVAALHSPCVDSRPDLDALTGVDIGCIFRSRSISGQRRSDGFLSVGSQAFGAGKWGALRGWNRFRRVVARARFGKAPSHRHVLRRFRFGSSFPVRLRDVDQGLAPTWAPKLAAYFRKPGDITSPASPAGITRAPLPSLAGGRKLKLLITHQCRPSDSRRRPVN